MVMDLYRSGVKRQKKFVLAGYVIQIVGMLITFGMPLCGGPIREGYIMATEKQKMLAGEMYDATDPELTAERRRARDFCRLLNTLPDTEQAQRDRILRDLLGNIGDELWIEPPFYCDYGSNITLGRKVFFNFNCVVLDPAPVIIGSNVLFGPAVQIYTATHPIRAIERRSWREYAQPVEIGSDVWVGGGAIIIPGVRIGPRSVIGAGSVVTRTIPNDVFAAGNPCRVIRKINA